jgi:hypothetical protein
VSDFEPFVADPAEPAPRQRLAHRAPAIFLAILLVLGAHVVRLVLENQDEQDPSLDIPAELLDS